MLCTPSRIEGLKGECPKSSNVPVAGTGLIRLLSNQACSLHITHLQLNCYTLINVATCLLLGYVIECLRWSKLSIQELQGKVVLRLLAFLVDPFAQ